MTSDLDSQEPNSLRECLPRYVNGTASAAERQAIDAALKTHPELRRELQEFQNLAASFEAREQISAAHADVLFQRIKSNIHIAPVPAQTPVGMPAIKLNIIFAPQATQQEVNRIMQQFGLRYVDGPSDTGMVIAALPDDRSNPGPVIEKLRQFKVVKFVEPLLKTS